MDAGMIVGRGFVMAVAVVAVGWVSRRRNPTNKSEMLGLSTQPTPEKHPPAKQQAGVGGICRQSVAGIGTGTKMPH